MLCCLTLALYFLVTTCWAACSCLNELDEVLMQDAGTHLRFVFGAGDAEEGTEGR